MYWGSFLLLRGFQRCCFGPAECSVFSGASDLGGVWLFRIPCRGAAFLRLSWLGCAMFLAYVLAYVLGQKVPFWTRRILLRVPKVLFWTRRMNCFLLCLSSDLGGVWCFLRCLRSDLGGVWLFRIHCRGAAFSACPGYVAPCFWSMYWGSFLLLRGFQRCCFGPAECIVFCGA